MAPFVEKTREQGDYDLSFMWFSYADPDTLRTIFYSKNIGNFNVGKYNDPEMDKLLLDAAAEIDQEKRAALYSQIQMKVAGGSDHHPAGRLHHLQRQAEEAGRRLPRLPGLVRLDERRAFQ